MLFQLIRICTPNSKIQTQTQTNLNQTLKMSALQNNISLYIPHVYTNYTKERITEVFENKFSIGKIKTIDLVAKLGKNGMTFNAAYIHFEYWYDNDFARALQIKVLDINQEAKLYYEEPWYWIVLENKSKRLIPGERKIRISLDNCESTETLPLKGPSPVKILPETVYRDETITKNNLNNEFMKKYEELEISTMDDVLSECPDQCVIDFIQNIEEEEINYLITIDGRYVQELETENKNMQMQLQYLQNMLQQQWMPQQFMMYNPMFYQNVV